MKGLLTPIQFEQLVDVRIRNSRTVTKRISMCLQLGLQQCQIRFAVEPTTRHQTLEHRILIRLRELLVEPQHQPYALGGLDHGLWIESCGLRIE